jgi:enoyl-CoA hydratase
VDVSYWADRYRALRVSRLPDGILEVRLRGMNHESLMDRTAHTELTDVWRNADRDEQVKVIMVRGAGADLSTGAELSLIEEMATHYQTRVAMLDEARAIVTSILDCGKPIVSVLHGHCIGAGLVPALLADISVAANDAVIMDGHVRVGLVAGDHAVAIWPLLCGMARAKRVLLLGESVSGAEAAQLGLVSMAVEPDEVDQTALRISQRLASGPASAIRWTKHALNYWLRDALPAFDASLALQFVGIAGPDAREGLAAVRERRRPHYEE